MASVYPGSLDSFSTSHVDNVNEIIHASTVNDLADAVNKIEAALGTNPVLGTSDILHTVAASGASQTINEATADVWDITLTAACTFTLSAVTSGTPTNLTLLLRQDATGSRIVTWPGSVVWLSGAVPVLHTSASSLDVITLLTVNGGTTWYGAQVNPTAVGAWTTYDCAPTGFSGTPTQRDSRYSVIGSICHVYFDVTGTSNATTFTIQLPFTPAGYGVTDGLQVLGLDGIDNGVNITTPGVGQCLSAKTLQIYKDYAGNAWTASGTKKSVGSFAYSV